MHGNVMKENKYIYRDMLQGSVHFGDICIDWTAVLY